MASLGHPEGRREGRVWQGTFTIGESVRERGRYRVVVERKSDTDPDTKTLVFLGGGAPTISLTMLCHKNHFSIMPRSGENDCIATDSLNLHPPLCKEGRPTFEIPVTAERLHTLTVANKQSYQGQMIRRQWGKGPSD